MRGLCQSAVVARVRRGEAHFVEDRRDHFARSAPRRPKIYYDGNLGIENRLLVGSVGYMNWFVEHDILPFKNY